MAKINPDKLVLKTAIRGSLHYIWYENEKIAVIMQTTTSGRLTGNWTFEIYGRPGESRKSCHRHFRTARAAWDSLSRQL